MNIAGLTTLALIFFSFSVLFQLVTLPVEIDASRRAVAYIEQSGMSSKQVNGAKKVLTAAALTYVAAALTSIIQLLYLIGPLRQKLQPITNWLDRRRGGLFPAALYYELDLNLHGGGALVHDDEGGAAWQAGI